MKKASLIIFGLLFFQLTAFAENTKPNPCSGMTEDGWIVVDSHGNAQYWTIIGQRSYLYVDPILTGITLADFVKGRIYWVKFNNVNETELYSTTETCKSLGKIKVVEAYCNSIYDNCPL